MKNVISIHRAELINPFLEAVVELFDVEMGLSLSRGSISLDDSTKTSQEVNIILGITGKVRGQIVYSMSSETARSIAANLIGQPVTEFDSLAQSALSELGNIASGSAIAKLDGEYSDLAVTPPTLIVGTNVFISTLNSSRIRVIMQSEIGDIEVTVALREQ